MMKTKGSAIKPDTQKSDIEVIAERLSAVNSFLYEFKSSTTVADTRNHLAPNTRRTLQREKTMR